MSSAGNSAISNVRWLAISRISRVVIQLVGLSIFARLLPPADFGLMAMAIIVINFAALFRDMGTAAAIIQRDTLSDELLDTVFWSNVVFGVVLAAMLAAAAPPVAATFEMPMLQPVLILLALAFPLAAVSAAHQALLERANRFRSIATVEIVSSLVGILVGVVAAWNGGGVFSLVLQTLVTTGLSTCQYFALSGWRPNWRWHSAEFRSLWGFSGNLVGFNIINYFARNADGMLIGRFLGSTELGLYNIGYRLMLFPLQNLTSIVNRAFYPVYSRQQDDPNRIGRYYLKTLAFISFVTAPLMLGLWSLREPFVEVVLGEAWLGTTPIIAWLAPTGYLQSLLSTTGTVLMARGRTNILLMLGIVNSALYLTSFVVGLEGGAIGVARAYFFANIAAAAIALHFTLRQVDLTLMDGGLSVVRSLTGAIAMVVVIALVNWAIPDATAPIVRLAGLALLGAGVYTGLLLLLSPDSFRQMNRLLTARLQ